MPQRKNTVLLYYGYMTYGCDASEAIPMKYRKFGDCYYLRLDRGDELMSAILDMCSRENVRAATFGGIGGCSDAEIQVFYPERGAFETERVEGLLELVNVTGNVISDDNGQLHSHAHAQFAYRDETGEQQIAAGHLKATTVRYTAEIELRPVINGTIGAILDPETGTYFWNL